MGHCSVCLTFSLSSPQSRSSASPGASFPKHYFCRITSLRKLTLCSSADENSLIFCLSHFLSIINVYSCSELGKSLGGMDLLPLLGPFKTSQLFPDAHHPLHKYFSLFKNYLISHLQSSFSILAYIFFSISDFYKKYC